MQSRRTGVHFLSREARKTRHVPVPVSHVKGGDCAALFFCECGCGIHTGPGRCCLGVGGSAAQNNLMYRKSAFHSGLLNKFLFFSDDAGGWRGGGGSEAQKNLMYRKSSNGLQKHQMHHSGQSAQYIERAKLSTLPLPSGLWGVGGAFVRESGMLLASAGFTFSQAMNLARIWTFEEGTGCRGSLRVAKDRTK